MIGRSEAITNRNRLWSKLTTIPGWVDTESVGLDQFFTRREIAQYCVASLESELKKRGVKPDLYKFIEPSAGLGAFFDLLPRERRIGLDIMPQRPGIKCEDFLSWSVKPNGFRYITLGNPPFGYRAWLALAFVNHAAQFSDYVAMILPMAFQSDGKGSPKHRVKGMELIHSEILPPDSFTDAMGNSVKVNALWQIWRKGKPKPIVARTCDQWIDLFTVDQRKERLCGQDRMHEADRFLQRTFYNDPPSLVMKFSDVRYVCGYGIVLKKEKKKLRDLLNSVDWRDYSNLAAHNCRHISMYHIRNAVIDAGFVDG